MKVVHPTFVKHFETFRGEIQEIEPRKLNTYCHSILKEMKQFVKMIKTDPSYAAMGFYGKIEYLDPAGFGALLEADSSSVKWSAVKPMLKIKQDALTQVMHLEAEQLDEALVIIAAVNFLIAHEDEYSLDTVEESAGDLMADETDREMREEGDLPDSDDEQNTDVREDE